MNPLTLYFVNADGGDLEPHANDLFVYAENPAQAVGFWQAYYDTAEEPTRVDEIPKSTRLGPIRWEDVPAVWFR